MVIITIKRILYKNNMYNCRQNQIASWESVMPVSCTEGNIFSTMQKAGNVLTWYVTNSLSKVHILHGVLLSLLIVPQMANFSSAAGNIRSPHLQRGRRLPYCCKREDSQEQCSSGLHSVTPATVHPATSEVHQRWVPSWTNYCIQSSSEVTTQLLPRRAKSYRRS